MIEAKMREALRLRHMSYSTEKTYILWARGFRAFVKEKDPALLEGRDLQDYLSHLAVEKHV
ncbi:MAG: site-specific integrase, partial [Nitrospirota bacterium]